jgi:hypothetical protein
MLNKYFKDNTHRHKKEKEIDKHLMREEKRHMKELEKKVEIMEKIAEVKLLKKRHRDEEENKSEIKQEDSTEGTKEVETGFAIEKILKHISKKDKFERCLGLLENVLSDSEKVSSIVVIKVFHYIMMQQHKFTEESSIEVIKSNIILIKEFIEIFQKSAKNILPRLK